MYQSTVNLCQSAANLHWVRTLPLLRPDAWPATCLIPLLGEGGATAQQYGSQPTMPSTKPASPTFVDEGRKARPAGCQLPNPTPPPPPNSPFSLSWASVFRGGFYASMGELACARQQPDVTAADFTSLCERCMASVLKAQVIISCASVLQVVTMSCSLPMPTSTTVTTAGRRRRCHHHCH